MAEKTETCRQFTKYLYIIVSNYSAVVAIYQVTNLLHEAWIILKLTRNVRYGEYLTKHKGIAIPPLWPLIPAVSLTA
jgi:hypothetical protein